MTYLENFTIFHKLASNFKKVGFVHPATSRSADDSASSDSELKPLDGGDVLDCEALQNLSNAEQTRSPSQFYLILCLIVNVLSTVSIVCVSRTRQVVQPTDNPKVFVNKYIFSNEDLRRCQLAFASYHFFITGLTLWICSRPCCGIFIAKGVPVFRIWHLFTLTCAQVVLQNLSLAYSSIIFHQLVRLLLTPATAVLNFLLYRATISKASILPLVILCFGMATVFDFNSLFTTNGAIATTPRGVIFAFAGVFASSLYTALVGRYQKKLQVNSMQLLLNQAPASAGFILCMAPLLDTAPTTASLSPPLCLAILIVSCLDHMHRNTSEELSLIAYICVQYDSEWAFGLSCECIPILCH